ncbi:MAG: DUF2382 domain-containing protein [Leptolyngbyaceae cyanobacterium bins.302]|nr:DUF2382 domain-containing protein [Leptolyngbyaceae cyanobacterium bins.302]
MALYKIKDFDPDYKNHFDQDILGFELYSGADKIGSVDNLLVDEQGHFRYLVINTGVWIFGKKVLLPIGRSRISFSDRRVYADGLTREQVEQLPDFGETRTIDYDHEERVRGSYRQPSADRLNINDPIDRSASLDRSAALEQSAPLNTGATRYDRDVVSPGIGAAGVGAAYDRDTYNYDRDPDLYNLDDRNHQNLRLYEERLIANKTRQRTGEVRVGKHVETETAHVSVPIEKERVVVERSAPVDAGVATPGAGDFHEGEVARIEVYEETPDIRKEAFVREEVRVRKEVERQNVEAEETLRKERLDIDTDGNPIVDRGDRRI